MRLYVTEHTCYKCKKKTKWPWDEMLPCPLNYECPCLKGVECREHEYWEDDSTKIIMQVPQDMEAEYIVVLKKRLKELDNETHS